MVRGFKVHLVLPEQAGGFSSLIVVEHAGAPTLERVLLEIDDAGLVTGARQVGVLARALATGMDQGNRGKGPYGVGGVTLDYDRGDPCRLSIKEGGRTAAITLDVIDMHAPINALLDIESEARP